MNIDLKKIEADLAEGITGKQYFKVKSHTGARLSIYEIDKRIDIRINPKKVRTQNQLDDVVAQCQEIIRG